MLPARSNIEQNKPEFSQTEHQHQTNVLQMRFNSTKQDIIGKQARPEFNFQI